MVEVVAGSTSAPPQQADLERLQESFKQRFPKSYLDFIASANGAKIVRNAVEAGDRPFVIERFLPIIADPSNDPNGWADVAVVVTQLDGRLVEDENSFGYPIIPFAALFAGDFLVFDYREGRDPAVARWDHEQSDELAPVTNPVAPSFEAFLKLLDSPAATTA